MKQTRSARNRSISIVIPAKNEAKALPALLDGLAAVLPEAEIIIVDDGSTDDTADVVKRYDVKVLRHPYSMGNGAAIKSGARASSGDVLVFLDADGQHDPNDIPHLLELYDRGYDLVIGCRDPLSQASFGRRVANIVYNRLASYVTGQRILDLTSGLRVVNRAKFVEFLHILPNGFSYPTTSTIAFFRAGYSVGFVRARVGKRIGRSHIRPLQDGLRFLLIIFKISTLYSPLKLFFPVSIAFFLLGVSYYLYTFLAFNRFTNMSALLLTNAVLVFLIGLVSEQITQLTYRPIPRSQESLDILDRSEDVQVARTKIRSTG